MKKQNSIIVTAIGLMMMVTPAMATADGGWMTVLGNVDELALAGRGMLLSLFYVGGLGLSGFGLFTMYQSMNPQKQKSFGVGLGALVIGVFLVILPNIIGLTAESTDGSGGEATERVQDGWD